MSFRLSFALSSCSASTSSTCKYIVCVCGLLWLRMGPHQICKVRWFGNLIIIFHLFGIIVGGSESRVECEQSGCQINLNSRTSLEISNEGSLVIVFEYIYDYVNHNFKHLKIMIYRLCRFSIAILPLIKQSTYECSIVYTSK